MKKAVVIKIGGATLGSHDDVITDVVELKKRGVPVVVVHGGAKLVTEWLKRQGVTARFVHGDRVTDAPALEMALAVLGGLVNKEIVAAINEAGGQAVGITGVDGAILQGEIREQEMGYVARIVKVNKSLLEALLGAGFTPVMAPLTMHSFQKPEGSSPILNANGDTAAGEVAAAIGAEKLIFLTDVGGIRDGAGKPLAELTADKAESLIADGTVSGGMIPKVRACLRAACLARIVDGRKPHALLREFEGQGVGTTIANVLKGK